jgi:uncharacterized protein YcgI (DUF1989 family)
MNVSVSPAGRIAIQPTPSTAGKGVTFRAERDVVVAVTACPAAGANAGRTQPLLVARTEIS